MKSGTIISATGAGEATTKRVVLLEDLDTVADEITGGGGKLYFGESQFDA